MNNQNSKEIEKNQEEKCQHVLRGVLSSYIPAPPGTKAGDVIIINGTRYFAVETGNEAYEKRGR